VKQVKVFVTPKRGVLDPQGKAVRSGLELMGFKGIGDVRLGKYIELEMENPNKENIEAICNKLLANTVIEDFHYEILSSQK
jgi:phosphoribosylformylglycinamidine synthase